jgi:geranylgeranyl reductase family protein
MTDSFDFAVIGGGPAGASAARSLALGGHRVVLFEAKRMPRRKLCGGAVSARALSHLGFPLPSHLIKSECCGARVKFRGSTAEIRGDKRLAVMVDRAAFDHYLVQQAEQAGACVRWERVTSLGRNGTHVEVRTAGGDMFAAGAAVVSAGANGDLIAAVRQPNPVWDRGFCLEAFVPTERPDRFGALEDLIEVEFGVAPFGYGWVFHHGTSYAIGIGGLRSRMGDPIDLYRRYARSHGFDPDLARPSGHFIPMGGVTRAVCGDRVLLAGDSAGFVDPVTGEGIAYAIRSGQLAAETLAMAAGQGDFSMRALAIYNDLCWRDFGQHLRWALVLARLMHRIPGVFIRVIAGNGDVLERFIRVVSVHATYGEFVRWLLPKVPALLARQLAARA